MEPKQHAGKGGKILPYAVCRLKGKNERTKKVKVHEPQRGQRTEGAPRKKKEGNDHTRWRLKGEELPYDALNKQREGYNSPF